MKCFAPICVFLLFSCIAVFATDVNDCVKLFKTCSKHEDCCSGCCSQEKCTPYSEGCNKDSNPCGLILCPLNKYCYLQRVQCIQAPCPPIPVCKPIDPDYD